MSIVQIRAAIFIAGEVDLFYFMGGNLPDIVAGVETMVFGADKNIIDIKQ